MTQIAELLKMSRTELAEQMARGHAIPDGALDGAQYRGTSLGMPAWFDRLLWKTFVKTFYRDPLTGQLRGWNVRLRQTGIDGPIEPLRRRGVPITFGHYVVLPAAGRSMPRPWNQGVFLDYGIAGNALLDPTRPMRAPVVSLREGSADLLLGWDYLQLGPLQIPTPAFWSLERVGPIEHVVPPPRPPA